LGLNPHENSVAPETVFSRRNRDWTHFLIPDVGVGLAEMKSRHWESELAPILDKIDGQVISS